MTYPQLSDLEILQQLARLGTFEETAAERNETVAELRRRIDRLESCYEVPLLAPNPGGWELTPAGQVLLSYGRQLLGLAREAERAVQPQLGLPDTLVVGLADVLPKTLAWRLLSASGTDPHPTVRLRCLEGPTALLDQQLAEGTIDLVLSDAGPPAVQRVEVQLLGSTGLSLFASRDLADRLAQRGPRWLDGAPMLLPAPGSSMRADLDGWLRDHALQPVIVGEFDDSALIKAFAADGAGVFAMHDAVSFELQARRGFVRLAGLVGLQQRVYAHVRADRRQRAPVQRLLTLAPAAFVDEGDAAVLEIAT